MKAEKAAKEKLEKQQQKAAQDAEKKEKKDDKVEEITDPAAYFENRSKAVTHLKNLKDDHPYPHKFHVKMSIK